MKKRTKKYIPLAQKQERALKAKLGYFVIKGTTDQVRSGQLLQDIKEMIQGI